jgi:twitching motility protein PilT
MARLDRFLTALAEYKAEALVLEQDQAPAFRFLSGTKSVSKAVLGVERILELIEELGSTKAVAEFKRAGNASFVYQLGDTSYSGVLEADAGRIVATLWEASQAAPEHGSSATHQPSKIETFLSGAINPIGQQGGASSTLLSAPQSGPASTQSGEVPSGEINLPSLADHSEGNLIPDDLPLNYRQRMDGLLRAMIDRRASDLHLCVGMPPLYRIDGDMQADPVEARMEADELYRMLFSIAPKRNRDEFVEHKDTDCAYAIEGVSRYRCNFFFDRNGPGAVFRAVPNEITSAEKLGLPPVVRELAKLNKGLVLVTGPTGSGKSTTLAAILDIVNRTRADHIITIEDPIEFVHPNKKCLVNQREVGVHTEGFKTALHAALREDPDVVLVGELRDLETVAMAIETAETGHLVLATLHTTTAPSTVDRLIDQFPPVQQAQVRVMLSESLRAVISQTLCKRKKGGRVAAFEILLGNQSVSNLIREGKTFQIESTIQTAKKQGMQTLNDHLLRLVQEDVIEASEAYLKAVDKQALREAFARNGIAFGD